MAKAKEKEVPILEKNIEREKDEDPLQFPDDPRPGQVREDIENEGRKPSLGETEEDSSEL